MSHAYLIQQSTAAVSNTALLAINNPAGSRARVLIKRVENSLLATGAASDFRLDRFPALATSGTAALFEPGDDDADLPRVCRRDSTSPEPTFVVLGGAFVAPSGRESDEWFALRSRDPALEHHEIDRSPVVVNPGECAVLTLLASEASAGARVAVEVHEEPLIPPIEITSDVVRLDGELFSGAGALSSKWSASSAGSGSASIVSGELVIATGATANSSQIVRSTRNARFLSDFPHELDAWVRLGDTGTANNIRRWGAFTASNGFFFELSGSTMRVVSRKGGVDSAVASASWDFRGFSVDTSQHRYGIRYTGGGAEFFVDRVLVHRLPGQTSGPYTEDLDLPITFENVNSGGLASDVRMHARNASILRYGPRTGAGRFLHMAGGTSTITAKSGAGTLIAVSVNGPGSGSSTVTIYDNTSASGDVIAIMNSDAQGLYQYGVEFSTGLTIAKTPGTAPDVTIVFD